jgi:hypothetical protein
MDVARTVAGDRLQRPDKPVATCCSPEDADHIVPLRFAASAGGPIARFSGRLSRTTIARWAGTAHEKTCNAFPG